MMYDNNKKPRDSSNFTQSHNFYTFSQKEFDPESSLSYFGARSYDAFSGTWTTQDIVRGDTFNPPTLHRYQYVLNNPLNLIDRFGFQADDPFTFTAPELSGITIEYAPTQQGITIELPEDYDPSSDPFFGLPQEPDPFSYGGYNGSTPRFSSDLQPTISGAELLSIPADNAKITFDQLEPQSNAPCPPKCGERRQRTVELDQQTKEIIGRMAHNAVNILTDFVDAIDWWQVLKGTGKVASGAALTVGGVAACGADVVVCVPATAGATLVTAPVGGGGGLVVGGVCFNVATAACVGGIVSGGALLMSGASDIGGSYKPEPKSGGGGSVDTNKLHHIFDKPGRGLDDFVKKFGSREEAFSAVEKAINDYVRKTGITGEFEEIILEVAGQKLKISGRVIDGVAKIGTFYK